jgi:hypothetical protein
MELDNGRPVQMNESTGDIPIQSFKDWQQILSSTTNKVSVLVAAFKVLHPDCPIEDKKDIGGRLAGMIRQKHDAGLILLKIWLTSPVNIAGSHLNYINATLKTAPKPAGKFETPKYSPDKYTSGKYSDMVQR